MVEVGRREYERKRMVKSLMIDLCGCSTKWLSFRRAIKLNAKPCPQGASPSYQVCPQQQPVLANKAIMRCQLGFHDQSKKRVVLFFQEKSAVFSKTVSWARQSPSPLRGHVGDCCLSNQESQPPACPRVGQGKQVRLRVQPTLQITHSDPT